MRTRAFFVVIGAALVLAVGLSRSSQRQDSHLQKCWYLHWQDIKSYRVIRCDSLEELEKTVSKKLDDQWRPIGSVSQDNNDVYLQVMVRQ